MTHRPKPMPDWMRPPPKPRLENLPKDHPDADLPVHPFDVLLYLDDRFKADWIRKAQIRLQSTTKPRQRQILRDVIVGLREGPSLMDMIAAPQFKGVGKSIQMAAAQTAQRTLDHFKGKQFYNGVTRSNLEKTYWLCCIRLAVEADCPETSLQYLYTVICFQAFPYRWAIDRELDLNPES